jgi:hypothetical protein
MPLLTHGEGFRVKKRIAEIDENIMREREGKRRRNNNMKKKLFLGPIHFTLLHFQTLKYIIKLTQVSPKVATIVVTFSQKRGRGAKFFFEFLK